MRTWEMIKELTENPNKKFKYDTGHENGIVAVEEGDIKLISVNGEKQSKNLPLHYGFMNQNWEEVKEPVDFMEVVQALDRGKTIYVVFQGYKNTFSPKGNQTDWGVAMKQHQGYAIDTEFILYGEWYIED